MVSPRTPMTKRYRPSNKSGKNSYNKANASGFDTNVFNLSQGDLLRRVMAMNGGVQQEDDDSEDDDTTDGYDSHQVSTSAYDDDSDEDDSEDDSSDDGIDEAQLLAMLQALQAQKKAKKAEKSKQRKKRYASTTNDEDDSDDNLSPSEMTEEQYFAYERRLAIKEEKLRAQKARIAESRARAGGSSQATPSSSSLSLPSTKDRKDPRNYLPYTARREASTGSSNISGWETPPGTPPSLLAPAKPPRMPSLDKPAPRKKKGAEFVTSGVTKNGVGTVDVHHYPVSGYPGASSSSKVGGASTVGSTASKIERFERKTSASSAKEPTERRKPSIDRKAPPPGATRGGKKRE